jgi:acyl-CoA-binding protein
MDVTELSMLLESLDCHEVTVAEIESAVSASSQLLNLDSNQKLLLYALYKQFLVGDVNIPEPDKKDLMASSKWLIN